MAAGGQEIGGAEDLGAGGGRRGGLGMGDGDAEDAGLALAEDGLADGSEEEAPEAVALVGAEGDEVGLGGGGHFHELVAGVGEPALDLDFGWGVGEVLGEEGLEFGFEFGLVDGVGAGEGGAWGEGVFDEGLELLGEADGDLGIAVEGEAFEGFEDEVGVFSEVEGGEDFEGGGGGLAPVLEGFGGVNDEDGDGHGGDDGGGEAAHGPEEGVAAAVGGDDDEVGGEFGGALDEGFGEGLGGVGGEEFPGGGRALFREALGAFR